jgi:hypothetical protein
VADDLLEREGIKSPAGPALIMGAVAGILVFFLGTLVNLVLLDSEKPFAMTHFAVAVAAGLAAFKMGAPLGRVAMVGIAALIGSSFLFWFAGCAMGTAILYQSMDFANPRSPDLVNAFQIIDIWGFILSVILIVVGALVGSMYGEP